METYSFLWPAAGFKGQQLLNSLQRRSCLVQKDRTVVERLFYCDAWSTDDLDFTYNFSSNVIDTFCILIVNNKM